MADLYQIGKVFQRAFSLLGTFNFRQTAQEVANWIQPVMVVEREFADDARPLYGMQMVALAASLLGEPPTTFSTVSAFSNSADVAFRIEAIEFDHQSASGLSSGAVILMGTPLASYDPIPPGSPGVRPAPTAFLPNFVPTFGTAQGFGVVRALTGYPSTLMPTGGAILRPHWQTLHNNVATPGLYMDPTFPAPLQPYAFGDPFPRQVRWTFPTPIIVPPLQVVTFQSTAVDTNLSINLWFREQRGYLGVAP